MSYLIALDDGHGMQTPGKRTPYISEIGRQIRENEFNRAVVKFLDIELRRCGFRTLLVAPTDADTPLSTRVALANSKKADAYVSVHYDAFDSKFDAYDPEGLTVFIYTGQTNKESGKLAKAILNHLKGGTPQKNRGIKEANFQVLRDTKMVAVLTENGFMDNKREALLMINEAFQKEVAMEHAKGLCDYFKVKYVPATQTVAKPSTPTTSKPATNDLYYITTGTFSKREAAQSVVDKIKKDKIAWVAEVYQDGKMFRVRTGTYTTKSAGESALAKILKIVKVAYLHKK